MANVGTLYNEPGATFNDNSITINAQQNYTAQFNPEQTVSGNGEFSSIIRFSNKRGMKIDLYRVILALLENGFFTNQNGAKPTQKEVFDAFGKMLGSDFSDFQKNLSQSKLCNNGSDTPTRIFDLLKTTIEEYYK